MKRVANLWAIIFLVALAVAVVGFPIAWYFDKDGEIVAWLTKNLTLNPMTVTVILAFLAWSVFEAWRSYTEQPTGEADQAAQGDGKRQPYGPHDDTEDKLRRLREYRRNEIDQRGVIPLWTVACKQVGIDPKIVKRHDQDLRKRWDDREF